MPRIFSQNLPNSSTNGVSCSQSSYLSQIPESELEDVVNKCTIRILGENFSLNAFKKSDLLSNAKVRGKASKDLICLIKKKLLDVYGLTLVESDNKFLLINPKSKILDETSPSKTTSPNHVFLGILLTLIVHSNGEITADELKSFFSTLSIDSEGDNVFFGNIKKLLNELENQHYIEKIVRHVPSEPSRIFYKWGLRSKHEVKKKDLIPIVSKMYRLPADQLPRPLIRLFSDDNV